MRKSVIAARAPSNIALIKYMGKSDAAENLPENPSVSMTLRDLCSVAELSPAPAAPRWIAERPRASVRGLEVPILGEEGVARILRHAARVKDRAPAVFARFGLQVAPLEGFELRTGNTFPPASGIASSASSFAAVTLAVAAALAEDPAKFAAAYSGQPDFRRALAAISRAGSGSSCRSFEGPWVLWEDGDAAQVRTRMPEMAHFVILVSSHPKEVSSSEAHRRVRTSPLWEGRVERVTGRSRDLLIAMAEGDLPSVARIAWTEAWEMHSLFHTAAEPFSYWQGGTMDALQWLSPAVRSAEPPIVTLDAGPNVHVIVPEAKRGAWRDKLHAKFGSRVILEDSQGTGAELL